LRPISRYQTVFPRRRYSDSLRTGGSGIESRWEGEVFRSRPDRPWGPPSLLYMGTVSFPGVKRPGVVLTTHPHLAPRLKKGRAIHLLPLWAFVVCWRENTVFPAGSLSPSDDSSTAQTTLRRVRHTDQLCSRAYHQDNPEKTSGVSLSQSDRE